MLAISVTAGFFHNPVTIAAYIGYFLHGIYVYTTSFNLKGVNVCAWYVTLCALSGGAFDAIDGVCVCIKNVLTRNDTVVAIVRKVCISVRQRPSDNKDLLFSGKWTLVF